MPIAHIKKLTFNRTFLWGTDLRGPRNGVRKADTYELVDIWGSLDLFFQILHQNLCLASLVCWSSPRRWCDCAHAGWWIPCSSMLPECGWAPELAVGRCTPCLLSGSDKKLLLPLDDMFNSVIYVHTNIYNTYIYNLHACILVVCVTCSICII